MARVGEMKCWNPACACTDIAVHQTAGGKLSAKCHKCQFEHWGPVGTRGHRDMMAATTMDDPGAPEPAKLPAPGAPAPAPAPAAVKKPRGVFSMGVL